MAYRVGELAGQGGPAAVLRVLVVHVFRVLVVFKIGLDRFKMK
jgi:hypothetical protein